MPNLEKIQTSGFTLIEILVAISILALAGAIAVPNYHRFNELQKLQNTTNDIKAALLAAQNDVQSGTKCNSDPSDYRSVYFTSSSVSVKCHDVNDSTDSNPLTTESTGMSVGYSDVTIAPPTDCGNPTYIIFSQSGTSLGNNKYLDQSTCSPPVSSVSVQVTNSSISSSECIKISSGGAVTITDGTCS